MTRRTHQWKLRPRGIEGKARSVDWYAQGVTEKLCGHSFSVAAISRSSVRRRFELAMLFITHDLRVAAQVCDRIAVMFQGEVVEQGPAVDVFSRPSHAYTRALFDAAPGRQWEFGKFGAA